MNLFLMNQHVFFHFLSLSLSASNGHLHGCSNLWRRLGSSEPPAAGKNVKATRAETTKTSRTSYTIVQRTIFDFDFTGLYWV